MPNFLAQVPPTPTFMPPPFMDSAPPLTFPEMGVWSFADDTVGLWNQFSEVTSPMQSIVIFLLVIVGIFLLMNKIRSLNKRQVDE